MYYAAHVVEGFLSTGIHGKYLCDYPRTLPNDIDNKLDDASITLTALDTKLDDVASTLFTLDLTLDNVVSTLTAIELKLG